MRKYLIGICVALVLVLTGYVAIQGIQIGKIQIMGISEIKNKNESLDNTLKRATKLASTDFQQKKDSLDEELKAMQEQKEEYEDTVATMTDSQVKSGIKTEKTIDFLFIRIENHAKSEGVSLKMELTKNSTSTQSNSYDLNFTVTGTYTGIEEFITDIEDDSQLEFSIEDFYMVATNTNGDQVEGTFICRDVVITGLGNSSLTNGGMQQIDTTNSNSSSSNTASDNTVDGQNSATTQNSVTGQNNNTVGN